MTAKIGFKTLLLKEFVTTLKQNGFKVYTSESRKITENSSINELISYVIFEKDSNLGYCQVGEFGGLTFSTIHKPNHSTGRGFRISEESTFNPTIQDALSTFVLMPNWARGYSIMKYKNFDEYRKTSPNSILKYVRC